MRRKTLAISIVGFCLGVAASWAVAGADSPGAITPKTQVPAEARALSRSFSSTAKALQPSVVRLDVEMEHPKMPRNQRGRIPPEMAPFFERFFDQNEGWGIPAPDRGTGSGFLLDNAGNILTNGHVVKNATKVTVTLWDGREFSAKVIGRDPETDVAVVRMEKPPGVLVGARTGDSDKVEVGEWVLAIGSPLGMSQTVTAGIVSSKGRVKNVEVAGNRVREYIQTDAKINPGNSGGPLVNLEGEVIGVNTFIQVGAGGAYGFAIPIKQAHRVAQVLLKDGKVHYAYLGVKVGDVAALNDAERAKLAKGTPEKAAFVSEVPAGTPAAKAGFRPGDVITHIDGQKIESAADVVATISGRAVGTRVQVTFMRDGKGKSVDVTLGALPAAPGEESEAAVEQQKLGLSLQTLTPDLAQFLGLDKDAKGAVIAEVAPGSAAAKAGLRAEDVIIEVNRKAMASADEVVAVLKENPGGTKVLRIRRGKAALFITIAGK